MWDIKSEDILLIYIIAYLVLGSGKTVCINYFFPDMNSA